MCKSQRDGLLRWERAFLRLNVGRDGDFDQIAKSAVKRAQHGHAEHRCDITWVIPYPKAEYTKNAEDFDKYYDYVIVCPDSEKAHPKQAIQVRKSGWSIGRIRLCFGWSVKMVARIRP